MKMKRKVQAQRKFAHGAPIPNSAGVPERRLCETITHNKDEHPVKTVFHNKMSAVNLLDIVSLQNVHMHFQPKVLLERLNPGMAKKNESNTIEFNIIKPTTTIPRSTNKLKRKFKKYRLGMCLRSKTKQIIKNKSIIKNKNIIKNLESHSTNLRKRKLINKKITKNNKLAKKTTSTEFSLDDDKPLKYFARNPKSSKIAERQFSKTRLGKQQEKDNAVSKITQKDKTPPSTEEEVERRPQTLPSEINNINCSRTTSETDIKLHYSVLSENTEYNKKRHRLPPISCLLHTPRKFLEDDESSHVVDVHENKSTAILDKGTDKNIIQSSGYYGTKEIVQWINNSISTDEPVVDDDRVNFKVPKPPKLRVDERRAAMNKPQASDTGSEPSCPSEYYTTVKEVVHASRQKTQKLCKDNCKKCNRVNKVRKLSNMFKNPTELESSKIDDIYEFDDQNDDAANGVSEYRSSKCFCPEDKDPQTPNLNHAEDSEPIYLDLLPPDSTQIIQITTEKVPNQETRMLRARLVCKSEEHHSDISLVEYEKILDKLFLNLNIPNTDESNATSAVATENVANPVQPLCNDSKKDDATEVNKPSTSGLPKKNRRENKNKKEVTSILKNPRPKLVDAPIFYPTAEEFTDPLSYIKQIMPVAAKFGLCKVVAPEGFNPKCTLSDEIKFAVTNQYIARLYSRWGPAAREMCAIRAYLAMQKVIFTRPPLVEGMEINLPKLYHIVQDNGGLNNVIEKKRWARVAEQMRFTKGHNPEKKLDQVYVKYLLPYDTLSSLERQQMMSRVEKGWNKKNQKMIDRAQNPLQKQMRLLGDTDSSEDETEDESEVAGALSEAEDCVVPGRRMNLATFKKVAANVMHTQFPSPIPPLSSEVEEGYWRLVLVGTDHVCVNTASIDTGEEGYGFTKNQKDAYGKHPWNLKMLSHNGGNILRSLGPVLGVTVPTLHLGMVFSTSCWHRDPHGLPWIEYMHTGPGKIWYGIPNEQSGNFRRAVETLCPSYCQNKSIWLPSDIAMIPPSLLMEHNVSLSRVVQNPREFIIVIPKAYSCSISTGYTVSESVYFATSSWLTTVHQVFQEVRDSCEPTMFSLEQLLMAAAKDQRVSLTVLHQVNSVLTTVIRDELNNRRALENMGVQSKPVTKKRPAGSWNVREQDECEFCRTTLYLSKVTGITGKKSSMCLHHALRLLETPKHRDRDHSKLDLITFYTQVELQEIIDGVQKRLSSSS